MGVLAVGEETTKGWQSLLTVDVFSAELSHSDRRVHLFSERNSRVNKRAGEREAQVSH